MRNQKSVPPPPVGGGGAAFALPVFISRRGWHRSGLVREGREELERRIAERQWLMLLPLLQSMVGSWGHLVRVWRLFWTTCSSFGDFFGLDCSGRRSFQFKLQVWFFFLTGDAP